MMLEMKTTEFLSVLSSAEPVPGGGGACAAVGAFASALGMMTANLTVGKKKYADVEAEMIEVKEKLRELRDELTVLVDRDAEAFEPLARAYRLPAGTEEEKAGRDKVMEEALYEASIAPLDIMGAVLKAMELLRILGEKGSRLAVSDAGVGMLFAQAALEGASLNVFINTKMMKNREKAGEMNAEAELMIQKGLELKERVYADVLSKIK